MSRLIKFFTILVVLSMLMPAPVQGAPNPPPTNSFTISPGQAKKINFDGATLEVPAGSVLTDTDITINSLKQEDLLPLDQGMANATGGTNRGYRMLPHNTKFKKQITIKLPYNPAFIPPGMSELDLKTFFYNDQTSSWQELDRVQVDTKNKLIVSLSDHFTDFVNATITIPDHPDALFYNTNSLNGIQAANPGSGVNLIEPPKGNSLGTAELSYPIELPPGRGGMQPQLNVVYNSSGGNSWVGLGWDLRLSEISIDTRWGVPRYDPEKESETYLFNGEQLTPLAHRADLAARTHTSEDKVFHQRVEGAFDRVIRKGNLPTDYWWEVTDKNGVRYIYGDPEGALPANTACLKDANGNIFKWALREMRDRNGNRVVYSYDLVSNVGMIGGTVPGWQIYPKSINYTLSDGGVGPYYVEFTRETDRRPDVIIDARGGFKMITAVRLSRISVRYRDEQIRAYEFNYNVGAFSKSLLQTIRQLGENNAPFNQHSFSYYDEVQNGNGFSGEEQWGTSDDHVGWLTGTLIKGELAGNLNSFAGRGNATAISGAVTDSVGTHLYTGFNPTLPLKFGSGGVKVGYNHNWTNTILALIDINGDGLVDKVFQDFDAADGRWHLYYRLNISRPGAANEFGQKQRVIGIDEISKEESDSFSVGPEGYSVVSGFANYAHTVTTSSIYFTDANADGLPDLVKDGVIYFNRLVGNVITFSSDYGNLPVPIKTGAEANNGEVTPEDRANYEKAIDANPLLDSLRRWTAPYDGVITITAPVRLLQDPAGHSDGVRLAIQHNGEEWWQDTIPGTDFSERLPAGVENKTVAKGDRIYFRVQSITDGKYDQVSWDPVISYVTTKDSLKDINELAEYRYQASEDFTLAGRPGIVFQIPMNGEVLLTGNLQKAAKTTDEIKLVVTVFETHTDAEKKTQTVTQNEAFSQSLTGDATGDIPFQLPLTVNTAQKISLRVVVDSPINLASIQWQPVLTYTKIENGAVNQTLSAFNLPYDVDMYPISSLTEPQQGWTATQDGSLTVKPGFSSSDKTKGAVVFTVKRAGQPSSDPAVIPATVSERLAKETVKDANADPVNNELKVDVKQGDVLYFDFSTRDSDLPATITSSAVNVRYGDADSVSVPSAVHSPAPFGLFSQPYRGWAYAGYNGNRERSNRPVDESKLTISATIDTPACANSNVTNATTQEPKYDISCSAAYPYVPLPAADAGLNAWGGTDDLAYVRPSTISSSRLGVDSINLPGAGAAGANAPQLRSRTEQFALGGSVGPVFVSYSGNPGMLGVDALKGVPTGVSYSERDYIDMNGDGFPDVVSKNEIQYTNMQGGLEVAQSVASMKGWARETRDGTAIFGAGFGGGGNIASFTANAHGVVLPSGRSAPKGNGGGTQMPNIGLSGSASESASEVISDLIDINGDGLPDRIMVNGAMVDGQTIQCGTHLCVALNLGYSFAAPEPWGQGDISVGAAEGINIAPSLGFNTGLYDYAFGFSLEGSRSLDSCNRITPLTDTGEYTDPLARPCDNEDRGTSLQDINGDGLVDRVRASNNNLYVAFNTGNGFADEVAWATSFSQVGLSSSTSLGGGAFVTIPIGPLCLVGCYVIINPGADYTRSIGRQETQLRDVDGDGFADYLTSSNDNQLKVRRNLTGKTNLLATVSRPLGAVISLDYQRGGNTTDDPNSHWNLSRVEVFDGQSGDGAHTQVTAYTYKNGYYDRLEREFFGYQTVTANERNKEMSDAIYRSTILEFLNDSAYTKGLLKHSITQDAEKIKFVETWYTYTLRDVHDVNREPGQINAKDTTATLFPMLTRTDQGYYERDQKLSKKTYSTHKYDELGNVIEQFDAGDLDGPGQANDNVTATVEYSTCPDTYVVGIPTKIVVSGNGSTLRQREATVDCQTGDVLQVRQYLSDGSAAVTDLLYYPDGNLQHAFGPANLHGQRYQLTYEYDPVVATYVTSITDSFGERSTASFNYKYGETESTTDVNGNRIAYEYDMFGRAATIKGPYEQASPFPTIAFEYHPEGAVPWALTRHLDTYRNPADPIETVEFIDGLKRVIQTKKDGAVFTGPDTPVQDGMIVSGRVTFDFAGRVIEQYYPVTEPLGSPGVFNAAHDAIQPTRIAYDVLDRQTRITAPDNTMISYQYGFGPDRSGTTQFEITTTDANGAQSKAYHNVLQLIVGQKQLNQAGSQVIWTSYAYDPLKQLIDVTDDQGHKTLAAYDNLGRQVSIDSPDTGKIEEVYDLGSNVIARVTPNLRAVGKQIAYDYNFNRQTSINYPDNPGNNVTYTYGAMGAANNRVGRIVTVTSQAGTVELSYGKLGEVVKETNSAATFVSGHRAAYTTQYVYDTWNRLQSLSYPDGEVLTYGYDSGGQVNKASGVKGSFSYDYVRRMEYDKFGQRAFIEAGNNTRTQYSYRPDNQRLANLRAGNGPSTPFQNLNYTYDGVGNVLSLANDVPQYVGPTTQSFSYDDLHRLVNASGSYQFAPGKTNRYQLSIGYDSLNNILSKQQNNEIVQVAGTTVSQGKTSFNWAYQYSSAKPHAATHIGYRAFTYDANGNQLGWTSDLNGTRCNIVWDEENRIQSIANNGHEINYKYDAAGQRVIKRGPQGETVTVNQFYTIRNGEIGAKHVFVGETRLVSKLVSASEREQNQYFYHPDQLGSSNYVTDANGRPYEHIEYFPSGETWVQETSGAQFTPYLYTGKELDEETGLYYYGARYYDPRTSLWQSPDPAVEEYLKNPSSGDVYNAGNLNLYAYAQQNALKYIDPDGREVVFAKGSSSAFINNTIRALNYLSRRSKTANQVLSQLFKSKTVITLEEFHELNGTYKGVFGSDKRILWNPKYSPTWGGGGQISPALVLLHEGGHALEHLTHPKTYMKSGADAEEERNLREVETPAAIELHEPIRYYYQDTGTNPLSKALVDDPTEHTYERVPGPPRKRPTYSGFVPGLSKPSPSKVSSER